MDNFAKDMSNFCNCDREIAANKSKEKKKLTNIYLKEPNFVNLKVLKIIYPR